MTRPQGRPGTQLEKPYGEIEQFLRGQVALDNLDPATRHRAMIYVEDAAWQVLSVPDKGQRRNMLGQAPAMVRPLIEAEVMRLHTLAVRSKTPEGRAEMEERAALVEHESGVCRAVAEWFTARLWGLREWPHPKTQ